MLEGSVTQLLLQTINPGEKKKKKGTRGKPTPDPRRCMLIFEAIQPVTLSTKTRGTFPLKPGDRLNWPDEDVRKVLERCPHSFKIIETPLNPNLWVNAWRELAEMTSGIEKSDRRFKAVLDLLNLCDKAFEVGNWTDFERLAEKVRWLCEKR